jgi:hypothetical protein
MRDLEARAQRALSVFSGTTPIWKMIAESMKCFAGLNLTALSPAQRKQIDVMLLKVNRILSLYPLETEEDYRTMTYAHQFEILTITASLCESILKK